MLVSQAAATLSAIASHPTLLRLPGLTRQRIIYDLIASSSRLDVWQIEDARVWKGDCWPELLGQALYDNGLKLLPSTEVGSLPSSIVSSSHLVTLPPHSSSEPAPELCTEVVLLVLHASTLLTMAGLAKKLPISLLGHLQGFVDYVECSMQKLPEVAASNMQGSLPLSSSYSSSLMLVQSPRACHGSASGCCGAINDLNAPACDVTREASETTGKSKRALAARPSLCLFAFEVIGALVHVCACVQDPSPAEEEQQADQQQQQQQQQQQEFLPICYQLRLNAQPRRRFGFLKSFVSNFIIMGVSFAVLELTLRAVNVAHQKIVKRK